MSPVAFLIGVLELVEGGIFRVEQLAVPPEEALVDHPGFTHAQPPKLAGSAAGSPMTVPPPGARGSGPLACTPAHGAGGAGPLAPGVRG